MIFKLEEINHIDHKELVIVKYSFMSPEGNYQRIKVIANFGDSDNTENKEYAAKILRYLNRVDE